MVRFGLIGPGAFGRFVLESVSSIPELELRWVSSRRRSSAEAGVFAWKEARSARGLPEGAPRAVEGPWQRALEDPVDLVVVATPPDLQGEAARAALERGAALFLEKPGDLSAESLRRTAAEAANRGTPATIDFVMRYNPLVRGLRALVHKGLLGRPEHVQMENWAGGELPADHWFWDRRRSGGILIEHGVHFFDMVRFILGGNWKPVLARVWESPRQGGWTAEDRVLAVVEHRGPDRDGTEWRVPATYYHGFTRPGDGERTQTGFVFSGGYALLQGWIPERLEMRMDGGVAPEVETLFAGDEGSRPARVEREGNRLTVVFPDRQELYRRAVRSCMEDLLAALREGRRETPVSLEAGVEALGLAEALSAMARPAAGTVA